MKKHLLLFGLSISFSLFNAQVFNEDFESTSSAIGTFPSGWTTSNSQWTINDLSTGTPGNNGNNTIVEPSGTSNSSGNCTNVYAIVDSDGLGQGNTQNTDLISPTMNLSSYSSLLLEFNHSFEVFGNPVARVEASIDNGTTWILIHDYGNNSNYGHQMFNISSLTGNSSVQIRFHYEGDWDWWWAIDDVEVNLPPPCPAPPITGINVNSNTDSSANISWVAGGSEIEWNMEYGLNGFSIGNGTLVNLDSNYYSFNSLNSSSAYDFYLQAVCDTTDSSLWTGPYTFFTICDIVTAPFLQDFNSSFFPSCLVQSINGQDDVFDWTLNSGSTPSNGTGPIGDISGSGNYIYIETTSPRVAGDSAVLVTNNFDISSLNNQTLTFYSHMFGGSIGTLRIDASNNGGNSYNNIFSKSGDQGNQWNLEIINLNGLGDSIRFKISATVSDDGNGTQWQGDISIDNFEIKEGNLVDMEMTSLDIPIIDIAGSTNIVGQITNYGIDTITSLDIIWNDGTGAQSETFNVSLALNESYNFNHSTPIQTTAGQTYNIDVEVIASGDADNTNNMLSHTLYTSSFLPFKKVLFEDQTIGANDFGYWSPRGIVRLEEVMLTSSIDSIEIISVHGNVGGGTDDAMYNLIYNAACFGNAFVSASAYPQNIIDRKTVANYGVTIGSTIEDFNDYKNDFGVADIEVYTSYDTSNRDLTVSAEIKFAVNYSNLNLALVITEDSVHDNTDMGYSQFNAYNGGGNGPLASTGLDFTTAGNPVPPSLMYFKNVAREIIPSYIGSSTALPVNLFADSTYNFTFPTYSVPLHYDQSRLRAIVLLIDPSNGKVYNTNGKDVDAPPTSTVGINEINLHNGFVVFPNPTSDKLFIQLNYNLKNNAEVTLTDLSGKQLLYQTLSPFNANRIYELDKLGITKGVYIISLKNKNTLLTKKIVFE